MKFGVLQFFAWKNRADSFSDIYANAMNRIQVMDETGYDAVWLAEHHFSDYSVCPSVHMMGTWIASQTKNLRIGTAISLAAFYHPLRLAEEVALLDVLSEGRVNWGAGRGFDNTEFTAFDVPPEESYARYRENVEIVLAAWNNERMSFEGKYHSFEDIEVLPKPYQDPHPPVWLAASSPEAVISAAKDGYSILMDPHAPHVEIAAKFATYSKTLDEHGHAPANTRDTPIARLLAVADTEDGAQTIAEKGAGWLFDSYVNPETHGGKTPGGMVDMGKEDPVGAYLRDRIIYGTPERVIDQVHELQEQLPLNYLLCAPLSPGSFDLFTEKVMPKFL
jgi:alkanesulfonate monooxygenase SsuD/methylene tetrahydromethanopterin reductase-like flavin-dependent oxidoreductase (luciferase family)